MMQRRTLGTSDLSVSRVCLGTMTFGTPVSPDDAVALIRGAAGLGVDFIDTANMYEGYARVAGSAGGVAEEIVGRAISGRRDDFVVATKLGMKVGDAEVDEYTSPAAIRTQLDRSLRRLGTDHVDVYYLHRPDPHTPGGDVVAALGAELAAGRIRSWGVSNYGVAELAGLVAASDELGVPRPVVCQPRLNLLDTAALDELVPYCVGAGISVIPYQGLAGGLLTGKYRRGQAAPAGSRGADKPDWVEPIDDELQSRLDRIEADAVAAAMPMASWALRWLADQPGVDSVLVGATRLSQVEAAITALG
ncbi:MAG: aldo/keto reductase [Propionibacteriaceae bacterium]|nr:aldo/keto reductase [Propionibacteriaceae bacterium]